MASHEIRTWTLFALIRAFVDLFLAYLLLCGSALVYFPYKLLAISGLSLPCPCKGVLGYRNRDLCLHKLLIEWPVEKIYNVQMLALESFPFNLLWLKDQNPNEELIRGKPSYTGFLELDDEASCSSRLVDRESGRYAQGKRIIGLRRKLGARRRRRANQECVKLSSIFPLDNAEGDVALGSKRTGETSAGADPVSGRHGLQDDEDGPMGNNTDEKTCNAYELHASFLNGKGLDKCSSFTENGKWYVDDENDGNGANVIQMLEMALEKEQATHAALYLELEKERAAAATAADEAMAMILRLQEEKASMEMETRHYQRVIEERFSYDEEEMNILKEILIRREKENHSLVKELEAFRQMTFEGNEQPFGVSTDVLDEGAQNLSFLLDSDEKQKLSSSLVDTKTCTMDKKCLLPSDMKETDKEFKQEVQVNNNLQDSKLDTEPAVLDVHIVDNNIKITKEKDEQLSRPSFRSVLIQTRGGRNSVSANRKEKLKIDTEISLLGERLRLLQDGKQRLTTFPDYGETNKGQLNLLKEIVNQLQEIKELRDPIRQASLPPLYSKLEDGRIPSVFSDTCDGS